MTKYFRVGLGIAAGLAAGFVVYKALQKKRGEKLVMPGVKASNIVSLHARRPPYAEAAEAGMD